MPRGAALRGLVLLPRLRGLCGSCDHAEDQPGSFLAYAGRSGAPGCQYAAAVSIRETFIAARGDGEDDYTEPPGRELNLTVIGADAHLSVVELDERGQRQPGAQDVVVPARSLLLALQAAVDDNSSDSTTVR